MPTPFTADSMKFLRGLARNNDRDWFEARRPVYEQSLRTPMLALIEDINTAMQTFAPEHIRPPHKVMMRIYRDIRFSKNKQPYKTNLAAWWSRRGMEKTSGGGFYLQLGPQDVMIAAGVYMPEREQLLALRRWMSNNHEIYRAAVAKLIKTRGMGFTAIDAQGLTRMPKGFATNDPADELVRAKNWGVRASLPVQVALDGSFSKEIIRRMRLASPLVDTLNEAILGQGSGEDAGPRKQATRPLF
jgi:uncharacterized protein (TIGR02453 family)